jgi:hypothetical protein
MTPRTGGMTLRVYVRKADGRIVELRPTRPVVPVSEPDIFGGLRFPPCACPAHPEQAEPGPPPHPGTGSRPEPTSGPGGRGTW